MDRRSYLTKSDLMAASAASASRSVRSGDYTEAHRLFDEAQKKMSDDIGDPAKRLGTTAVTTRIACFNYEPTEVEIDMPEGFVPYGLDSTYTTMNCYEIEILDDKGSVIKVIEAAFNGGSLVFWRAIVGKIRCRITWLEYPTLIPQLTVTIYGTIALGGGAG